MTKVAYNDEVGRPNLSETEILWRHCCDVAHDVDVSFGNVKMTLKSVRYLTASIAVLRDCRELAIRKVACSNAALNLWRQAQYSLVTHIMYINFER